MFFNMLGSKKVGESKQNGRINPMDWSGIPNRAVGKTKQKRPFRSGNTNRVGLSKEGGRRKQTRGRKNPTASAVGDSKQAGRTIQRCERKVGKGDAGVWEKVYLCTRTKKQADT